MNSILDSIKQTLGIMPDVTAFDTDIIMAINTACMTLSQLGVGPVGGFSITNSTETWDQLLGTSVLLEAAKSFVYIKTRLLFDPPSSSFVLASLEKTAEELAFRLMVQIEPGLPDEEGEETDE